MNKCVNNMYLINLRSELKRPNVNLLKYIIKLKMLVEVLGSENQKKLLLYKLKEFGGLKVLLLNRNDMITKYSGIIQDLLNVN